MCWRAVSTTSTRASAFIRNSATVTRPTLVRGTILPARASKCSSQTSVLGLKRATIRPLSGSIDARSEPLCRLHSMQASARFALSVLPPCFTAITWSGSWGKNASPSPRRQYSQHAFAREKAERQLFVVTGRAQRHGQRAAVHTDLEGALDRHVVVEPFGRTAGHAGDRPSLDHALVHGVLRPSRAPCGSRASRPEAARAGSRRTCWAPPSA